MGRSTTIKTEQLDSGKSTYLIELKQLEKKGKYIEIHQTNYMELTSKTSVKINPSVLLQLIKTLQSFYDELENYPGRSKYVKKSDQERIIKEYLKGLSIQDLCLLMRKPKSTIENVLNNANITILTKRQSRAPYFRRRKKK